MFLWPGMSKRVCGKVLPSSYSVRSRVHEYGGGEFCVGDGAVFFVNALNQQIYRCLPSQTPEQITTASEFRFADLEYNQDKNRLIAVAERHLPQEPDRHSCFAGQYVGLYWLGG